MTSTSSDWVRARRDIVVVAALVAIGTLISLVRVPAAHHDIVWAEDGNMFLFENMNQGPWQVLFRGYAGYQHLVPRIASSGVIAFADLAHYATATFWVCSFITGLVGAAVYWLSRDVIPWIPARLAAAGITFLIPLATQEVIGNYADLHTYFLWLAPWLLFYRPKSWVSASAWALVAFLTMMTEVQAILFLLLIPFVLGRGERKSLPIIAAFMAGAVWQIATALSVPRASSAAWLGIPSLIQGWLIATPMPMVIADPRDVQRWLQDTGFAVPLAVSACFLIAYVIAMVWGTPRQRLMATVLLLASGAIYAAGATVQGSAPFRYAEPDAEIWERIINVRYGVASGMMLAAIVPVAAAAAVAKCFQGRRARAIARIAAGVAIAGMLAIFAGASTQAISARGWVSGPWSAAVETAIKSCAAAPETLEISLPVAPQREVFLTCAQILR